jgi:type II secretion system protein E
MAHAFRHSLGKAMLAADLITADDLTRAQSEQERSGGRLEEILVRLGVLSEDRLLTFLSEHLNLEYVRDVERQLNPEVLLKVPSEFAMRHQVLPLQQEDGTLVVALADPFDVTVVDDLRLLTQTDVRPVIAKPKAISEAIEQFYMEKMFRDIGELQTDEIQDEDIEIADLQKMARETLIIKLVNLILHQAVQERASDVHIEPHDKFIKVRYRVDGVLYDASSPPRHLHSAIVSRVKIMADMDIAERRLPQDGRVRVKVGDGQIDLRISTVPTLHGESVVIRLLDRSRGVMRLEELGMRAETLSQFRRLITRPHGILLVTGPTGSGKTTTLYGALGELYSPERKVITIEEPVEYELPGANQIQVRSHIGLTFATGLRHIVRQDPDIIMVGEIRDRETADIAIHAALTGHLVLSTLHTNDAPGALTRLLDMGIEPYLVASSMLGVLAQRLLRLICPYCQEEFVPEPEALREIELTPPAGTELRVRRGLGCDRCRQTGYHDRTGIFEFLPIDERVRQQVLDKVSSSVIKQQAVARGMRTLLADGREKVLEGVTAIEELLRVCQRDEV